MFAILCSLLAYSSWMPMVQSMPRPSTGWALPHTFSEPHHVAGDSRACRSPARMSLGLEQMLGVHRRLAAHRRRRDRLLVRGVRDVAGGEDAVDVRRHAGLPHVD